MSITIPDHDMLVPDYITFSKREAQELFLHELFGSNLTAANHSMGILRDRALILLKNDKYNDDFIKLTHKIWLTNVDNPSIPNDTTLSLLKEQYENLPILKHILWTNHT